MACRGTALLFTFFLGSHGDKDVDILLQGRNGVWTCGQRDTSVTEKNILPPFSLEDRGSM
jgi:hypothetical protein